METRGNTSAMSYQEYQKQLHVREERAAAQAQQAITSAGLDSFSQQVNDTVQRLRQIGVDLNNAQKQLEAQMSAQQRQLQQMQQHIDAICNQMLNSFKSRSGGGQSLLQ
ncbi:hypothetical protein [Paenibacillus alkalitolerans]|uniref:hypothetical protein n=1 Tax=Paenibacillus alkalitolerans TaxID=2799335 RepID=UPI0018F54BF3|nr:hypothetical protein [Paenibacillus alkalitolerans]